MHIGAGALQRHRETGDLLSSTVEKTVAVTPNLRPWRPGQRGNPGGRPKKKPVTELYEQLLNDTDTIEAIRATMLRTIRGSKTNLVPLLREMADRVEGKMTQPIYTTIREVAALTDAELQDEIERLTEGWTFASRQNQAILVPTVPAAEKMWQASRTEMANPRRRPSVPNVF